MNTIHGGGAVYFDIEENGERSAIRLDHLSDMTVLLCPRKSGYRIYQTTFARCQIYLPENVRIESTVHFAGCTIRHARPNPFEVTETKDGNFTLWDEELGCIARSFGNRVHVYLGYEKQTVLMREFIPVLAMQIEKLLKKEKEEL